jgi:hypothetical protein
MKKIEDIKQNEQGYIHKISPYINTLNKLEVIWEKLLYLYMLKELPHNTIECGISHIIGRCFLHT